MENYKIIPRRFRPKRFSDVFGQEPIVTTLKNALTHQRIGQAYLFCGARGCGKTSLARLFAKSLNCTQLADGCEPCCTCTSCMEISEGRSLDVIEIDGASNRGIDDIRQINETVGYAPNRGNYKIYIIDEVHMLTKEAFNALLKTLEEPPKHIKFFFATTEAHKLPATIISRCQRFNLGRIPEKALVEKLRMICTQLGTSAEEEALIQISHLSEGSLRDAESMLDQLICSGQTQYRNNLKNREFDKEAAPILGSGASDIVLNYGASEDLKFVAKPTLSKTDSSSCFGIITLDHTRAMFGLLTQDLLSKLDETILAHNLDQAVQLARQFYESGKDIAASIDSLLEHFRTYLLMELGEPARGIYKKGIYTKQQCLMLLDKLIQWQQSMLKTPFKQIHLEMLLLDLTRSLQKVSFESLVDRLIDLEARLKNETPVTQKEPESKIEAPKVTIQRQPEPMLEAPKVTIERQSEPKLEDPKATIERQLEPKLEDPKVAIEKQPEPKLEAPKPIQKINKVPSSKYETLVRFAAVELEGSVK